MTTALLLSSPLRPAVTTSAASIATLSNMPLPPNPATSPNSVRVGPGQRQLTLDPVRLQLLVQRLGQRQDERLGREIDRHLRTGLECRGRGDVEDRARFAPDHSRSDRAAEVGQRPDIEVDHLPLAPGIELGKAADQPEAGIVDEQFDLLAVGLKIGQQLRRRIRFSTGRSRPRAPCRAPWPAPRAGPCGEQRAPAGGRARQLTRELDAKPGRGAGDERDFLHPAAFDTVALTILPGSRGGSPTGSASTCSMPLSTSPQTVYWRSRNRRRRSR